MAYHPVANQLQANGSGSSQAADLEPTAYEVYAEGTFTYCRYYYENIHPAIQQANFSSRRMRDNLVRLGLVVGTPLAASLISGIALSEAVHNTSSLPTESNQLPAKATQTGGLQVAQSAAAQPTPAAPERLGLSQSAASSRLAANRPDAAAVSLKLASLIRSRLSTASPSRLSAAVESPQVNSMPPVSVNPAPEVASLPVANSPVANSSVASSPVASSPVASSPENSSTGGRANLPDELPTAQATSSEPSPDPAIAPIAPVASASVSETAPAIATSSVAPPEQLPMESSRPATQGSPMFNAGADQLPSVSPTQTVNLPASNLPTSNLPAGLSPTASSEPQTSATVNPSLLRQGSPSAPKSPLDLRSKASLLQSAHLTLVPRKLHNPLE
ncbi:MAG TPA: hypothetical protein V6C57_10295 [Coleofasciculaceae cyanobacterium]